MSKEEMRRSKSVSSFPDVRLAVLGASKVGKSAISVRFMTRRYIGEYEQNVENNYVREISFGDDVIKYELRDTAGNMDVENYISWATCLAVVYSIEDRQSFEIASKILNSIKTFTKPKVFDRMPLNYALISNKNDLDHLREVTSEEGKFLAQSYNAGFWEMSAADDYHSTHRSFSAMIVEAYFNGSNLKSSMSTRDLRSTRERSEFMGSTPSICKENKRRRRTSVHEKSRKHSVTHLLLDNFSMSDPKNNSENEKKELDDKMKLQTLNKREKSKSVRRDKNKSCRNMIKSQSYTDLKSLEAVLVTETLSLKSKNSDPNIAKEDEKEQAVRENLKNIEIVTPITPPMNCRSNTNRYAHVTQIPHVAWNPLMLGSDHDLSRMLRGRHEKKTSRMKISAIFKPKILMEEEEEH